MNHRVLAMLLAMSLLLSGCSLAKKLVPKSNYHLAVDHAFPNAQENEDATISFENKEDLEASIRSLIKSDITNASLVSDHYEGNLKEDCDAIIDKLLHEVLETAYVVRAIIPDVKEADMFYKLNLTIYYSHPYSDIATIKGGYVYSEYNMKMRLKNALENNEEKILLRVYHYDTALYGIEDYFNKQAKDLFEADPISIMSLPRISSKTYPETGENRILELIFDYSPYASEDFVLSPAELGVMKKTVTRFIDSASEYASYADSEREKAFQIYSYLTGLHHYTIGDVSSQTPAFDLLTKGIADSHIFAFMYNAMCTQAGLTCHVVKGQKDGEDYCWNILEFEDYACHLDIPADDLNNLAEPRELFDTNMEGYVWNRDDYPECTEPLPPLPPVDLPPQEDTPDAPEEPPNEPPAENNSPSEN